MWNKKLGCILLYASPQFTASVSAARCRRRRDFICASCSRQQYVIRVRDRRFWAHFMFFNLIFTLKCKILNRSNINYLLFAQICP